jgi:hypothetical protein
MKVPDLLHRAAEPLEPMSKRDGLRVHEQRPNRPRIIHGLQLTTIKTALELDAVTNGESCQPAIGCPCDDPHRRVTEIDAGPRPRRRRINWAWVLALEDSGGQTLVVVDIGAIRARREWIAASEILGRTNVSDRSDDVEGDDYGRERAPVFARHTN